MKRPEALVEERGERTCHRLRAGVCAVREACGVVWEPTRRRGPAGAAVRCECKKIMGMTGLGVSTGALCAGGGPGVPTSLVRSRDPGEVAPLVEVVKPLGGSKSGGACFVSNPTLPCWAFSHQRSSGLMERSR